MDQGTRPVGRCGIGKSLAGVTFRIAEQGSEGWLGPLPRHSRAGGNPGLSGRRGCGALSFCPFFEARRFRARPGTGHPFSGLLARSDRGERVLRRPRTGLAQSCPLQREWSLRPDARSPTSSPSGCTPGIGALRPRHSREGGNPGRPEPSRTAILPQTARIPQRAAERPRAAARPLLSVRVSAHTHSSTPPRIMGTQSHWPMLMCKARMPRKLSGSRKYSAVKRAAP